MVTEINRDHDIIIHQIQSGALCVLFKMYMNTKKLYWKLLAKDDEVFCDLYYVFDNIMKEGAKLGLGVVKHATLMSLEMEEVMWENIVLGRVIESSCRTLYCVC